MRRLRMPAIRALAAVLVMAMAACGTGGGEAKGGGRHRLRVVTTVAPITSIVGVVAGDRAEVRGIVPEGTDSHTFEPPPSAAATLEKADVIFVNGLGLEDPTAELARANLKAGAEIVELGNRTITPDEYIYDFSFPKEGGKPNPHLWTNPPMAKAYGRIAAQVLARRDPANAAAYRANYERFAAKVDELDRAMVTASATVPVKALLTYHDAYAYFARHYGWTVVGAIQPSSFDQPSPAEVAALIRQVRSLGVRAVFGSEVYPSPVLAQIGRETGARYIDVLRDDDLPGKPGDPEHSWLGLMRFDFITMVEALGGDASALRAVSLEPPLPDRAAYPQ